MSSIANDGIPGDGNNGKKDDFLRELDEAQDKQFEELKRALEEQDARLDETLEESKREMEKRVDELTRIVEGGTGNAKLQNYFSHEQVAAHIKAGAREQERQHRLAIRRSYGNPCERFHEDDLDAPLACDGPRRTAVLRAEFSAAEGTSAASLFRRCNWNWIEMQRRLVPHLVKAN